MALALLLVAAGAGCGTVSRELPTRFFPPPPTPPRIQFLQKIRTSNDVEPHTKMEGFLFGNIEVRTFAKIYSVAVHDGVFYVADTQLGSLVVVDPIHKKFHAIDDRGKGDMHRPVYVVIADDGTKYVSDYDRHQVMVYDAHDRFVRAFGDRHEFKPIGLAVYGDKLYVTDTKDHEVEVLDRHTGEKLATIGHPGTGPGEFYNPVACAVDKEGNLYVTDMFNARVEKFDPEGHFLFTFGRRGDRPGDFARPKGIAVDDDGYIYVVDAAFENVQIFTPDGKPAMFFGGFGGPEVPGALWLPAGVTITKDPKLMEFYRPKFHPDFDVKYLVLVACQFGPSYFNVYAFGEPKPGTPLAEGKVRQRFKESKAKEHLKPSSFTTKGPKEEKEEKGGNPREEGAPEP
ncbi:MAG: hypothetical protein D6739_02625 [Nitrospirae bacterium]|nr:MAG: hypothetical protein D6739_02625 [Nitrospirota bacterium]